MKTPESMGAVLLGYGFVVLGVLLAAYATRKGGFLTSSSPPGKPFGAMFLTGLWVGLILGGLGSIFYVSPSSGMATVVILVAGRFAIRRWKNKERGNSNRQ